MTTTKHNKVFETWALFCIHKDIASKNENDSFEETLLKEMRSKYMSRFRMYPAYFLKCQFG